MLRKYLVVVIVLLAANSLPGQKPALDFSVVDKWPSLGRTAAISNNGEVVVYDVQIKYQPVYSVIHDVRSQSNLQLPGATNIVINGDSRYVLYSKKDSLFIYDVKKKVYLTMIAGVTSFRIPTEGNGRWLAYQVKDKLILKDLFNGKETTYNDVLSYQFPDKGKKLLFQQKGPDGRRLYLLDLATAQLQKLSDGVLNARLFTFDSEGDQLAFFADQSFNGEAATVVRYYRRGMDSSIIRITAPVKGIKSSYTVSQGLIRFSPDGKKLFFPVKKIAPVLKQAENIADLNLWHYKDYYLPTEQQVSAGYEKNRTYTAVVFDGADGVVQLNDENDGVNIDFADRGNGDYALVRKNWNYFSVAGEDNIPSYSIVNLLTGDRKQVIRKKDLTVGISPGGKYVSWYDAAEGAYFLYDIATGATRNITDALSGTVSFLPADAAVKLRGTLPCGIAGWLPDDKAVLLYDSYDIWKIDLANTTPPVNVTRGYGKKNEIILRILTGAEDYGAPIIKNHQLILVAFDEREKRNGFFTTDITGKADPVKRSLDPCMYYPHMRFQKQFFTPGRILKARDANVFLLTRETAAENPNLVITCDFSSFSHVSDVSPQKHYNWVSAELLKWKTADGITAQAILYKPENFDPNKKYPVIFYFYEQLSHRLHQFQEPELSNGSISIPVYASNGYLVCTPDIPFKEAMTGESILHAVTGAARELIKNSWADSTRMGIQGHSFGGYGVNYIVAHSNLFAAAQESSGASNFISYYNGSYREHSAQFYFEIGQGRMGKTLWQSPQAYIDNSPIFQAPQVITPLLIMHNRDDGEVPFQQGHEWFTALRRLGKKVWMLQYDKETHAINAQKNKLDFSIRTMQFFDHYLKGASMPIWMSKGIPAHLKYVETGLQMEK